MIQANFDRTISIRPRQIPMSARRLEFIDQPQTPPGALTVYISSIMRDGSSISCLIFTRNETDSFPSTSRWS